MQYELFIEELKKVPCLDLRNDVPENFEFVVKTADLPKVNEVLKKFFGEPIKPTGEKPSTQAKKIADPAGGVRDDQTLYYVASEELYYYSLLWPWSNGQSVTVKVIRAG